MGQFFSWIRGTQETPNVQDVAVEEQSDFKQANPASAVPVPTVKPTEKGTTSSSSAAAKPGTPAVGASTPPTVTAPSTVPSVTAAAGLGAGAKASAGASPGLSTTKGSTAGAAGSAGTQSGSPKVTSQVHAEGPTPAAKASVQEKKIPADIPAQPEKHPKPLTTDEALESLSAGFVSSEVPSPIKPGAQKAEHVDDANARSSNAPSPQKKQDVSMPACQLSAKGTSKVEPASSLQTVKPKTDKVHAEGPTPAAKASVQEKKTPAGVPEKPKDHAKPLTDDVVDSFSAGFVSSSAPKLETKRDAAPPAGKKAKVEKLAQDPVAAATPSSQPVKSKTPEGSSMSLEALDALGDMLPDSPPTPEAPAPRPEDIVKERDLNPEKGVRVGEREDTLPPEYRFSEEASKKYPAPPKEPSLDPAEALDILSGDLSSCAVAPAVQAPPPPSAPPKQPKVEDLSALDALEQDFAVSSQTKKVACALPSTPATVGKSTAKSTSEGDPMSLDALSALEDTLPVAKPTPESPKLKPEDIVDEKKLVSEKGVRVGEREDTLPPDYRFPKEGDQKQPPPPRKEPSLDAAAALDILDKDFGSPHQASGDHAPLPPSAPPTDQSSSDFAIKDLAGDFVAPTAVSKVQSAVPTPPKADRQLSESTTSAMDALGDTLMDVGMTPEPAPVSPKDIVKEKEAVEERVSKPGERDDSIPEEYRPTEADKKADAEAKAKAKTETPAKQTSMDESAALDVLSSAFSTPSVAPPLAPVAKTAPTQTVPEPVLDSLADTLRPHFLETKPKDSKSKVKEGKSKSKPKKPAVADVSVPGDVSGKMTTDVVSTSSAKKGGKS